ncbi:HET-domain-containing protein [Rostrohypoxylon terebratum]|nr:HET-domain-containing protein [Rostrohypoxylon terebratum]
MSIMATTEKDDDNQVFTSDFDMSSTSEECILPYHLRSPIIWCQERTGNLWGVTIAADIPTLRRARETGCDTCTLVCEALATYKNIPIDQLSGKVEFQPDRFIIHWYFPLPGEEKENSARVTLRFSITPGKCNPLPARTDSEETFTQIRAWLKGCTATHDKCRSNVHRELPTRLLDLHDVGSVGIARLIEGRDVPIKDGKYASLSHCWGGRLVEHATATKKSLGGLDIRYLWIDSMCIIQDDESDWERESKKMSSAPYPFECRTALGQPFNVYFQQRLQHHDDRLTESFQPLLKRAWVHQERLLSPRYLHFMLGEVVWDCNEHLVCQCEQRRFDEREHSLSFRIKTFYANTMRTKEVRNLKVLWCIVLKDYTYQALSFEKDRLQAVAGIVSHFSSVELPSNPGKPALGRYIEGLWEDTLCEDLCWTVVPQERVNPRPVDWRKWRAPTWSWASVQDPSSFVNYPDSHRWAVELAKIIEVTFVTHDQACLEQVQYNCIRLELLTTKMTLVKQVRSDRKDGFGGWNLQVNGNCLGTIVTRPDYDYAIPGPDQIFPRSPILGGLMLETQFSIGTHVEGLLLVLADEENALYNRIGQFSYTTGSEADLLGFRSSFSQKQVISLV